MPHCDQCAPPAITVPRAALAQTSQVWCSLCFALMSAALAACPVGTFNTLTNQSSVSACLGQRSSCLVCHCKACVWCSLSNSLLGMQLKHSVHGLHLPVHTGQWRLLWFISAECACCHAISAASGDDYVANCYNDQCILAGSAACWQYSSCCPSTTSGCWNQAVFGNYYCGSLGLACVQKCNSAMPVCSACGATQLCRYNGGSQYVSPGMACNSGTAGNGTFGCAGELASLPC